MPRNALGNYIQVGHERSFLTPLSGIKAILTVRRACGLEILVNTVMQHQTNWCGDTGLLQQDSKLVRPVHPSFHLALDHSTALHWQHQLVLLHSHKPINPRSGWSQLFMEQTEFTFTFHQQGEVVSRKIDDFTKLINHANIEVRW